MLGPLDVAIDVIDVLDGLDIDYALDGSLASSTFGEPEQHTMSTSQRDESATAHEAGSSRAVP